MLLRLLGLSLIACCVSCVSPVVVSPEPDLCTDWTVERILAFDTLERDRSHKVMAQMVTEWDETCAANAALMDKPWGDVVDSTVCQGNRFTCWWRGL